MLFVRNAVVCVIVVAAFGTIAAAQSRDYSTIDTSPELTLDPARPRTTSPDPSRTGRPGWDPVGVPREMYRDRYYFKVSGLFVEQQNDGVVRDPGGILDGLVTEALAANGTIGFDDGWGMSLGIGYHFDMMPLSIEVEWVYRDVDADSYSDIANSLPGDGNINLHVFAANLLFDYPRLLGPVGVYAGGGIGFRATELHISTISDDNIGSNSTSSISGDGLYVQAMAGLSVSLGTPAQLFGGVRWSDAGTIDTGLIRVDAEMISYEFGVRFFF